MRPETVVLNPLPRALAHYERALLMLLRDAGVMAVATPIRSAELHGHSATQRGIAAAKMLLERRHPRLTSSRALVLWPVFGLADPALWRVPEGTRMSVVVHDPRPLRRQIGMSAWAWSLSRRSVRERRPGVITHSSAASAGLRAMGWEVEAQLPLPLLRPEPRWAPDGEDVLVLGQYKLARDLPLMEAMAPLLRRAGLRPVVRGRGWPRVAGWDVQEGFLTEPDFEACIRRARCLIVPYRTFFQSDVAVRAAESGVPVVGAAGTSIAAIFGSSWPGFVASDASPEEWVTATLSAGALPSSEVFQTCQRAWTTCRDSWADFMSGLPIGLS